MPHLLEGCQAMGTEGLPPQLRHTDGEEPGGICFGGPSLRRAAGQTPAAPLPWLTSASPLQAMTSTVPWNRPTSTPAS